MTYSQDSSARSNAFDSVDFKDFLQKNIMRSTDSKSGFLGSSDFSMFKSNQSFVSGFMSKDYETKPHTKCSRIPENVNDNSKNVVTLPDVPIQKDDKSTRLKSQDWLNFNTLGKHVEIPYSAGIFSATANSGIQDLESCSVSRSLPTELDVDTHEKRSLSSSESKMAPIAQGTKRKRKRAPRKKIIPLNKKYLEPTEKDVLMGRGGKSNHHRGNMRYRAEIERLQGQYKKTDDKDEKTKISEMLVSDVQSYGGNFLEKDDNGWYVIDDMVARRKVSQALREDKDPEKRRAKRQRFLEKKANKEKNARI